MIRVPRNTFYIKQTIEEGVNVNPIFKDLTLATEDTFELGEGSSENTFVLSGSVPDYPEYGAGELDGAYLSLYCKDITSLQTRDNPKMLGYVLKPHVDIKEGGYTLAHQSGSTLLPQIGNLMSTYYVNPVNTIPYISEEFEGAVHGFQDSITRTGGGGNIVFSGPFITRADYKAVLHKKAGSFSDKQFDQHLTHLGYNAYPKSSRRWTATPDGDNTTWSDTGLAAMDMSTLDVQILTGIPRTWRIKPGPQNYSSSRKLWSRAFDGQLGDYWFHGWSMEEWGSYIQYKYQHLAPSDFDNQGDVTQSNTVFSDMYATRNKANPFQSNVSDPLILTSLEFTTEKALNDGQSMRMYHNWGDSQENYVIQNDLGVSGNLNPQCCRASFYNIPMAPFPFDLGRASVNADLTTANYQNHVNPNSVLGEIRMPINISKLGEMMQINADSATSIDTLHSYFYDADISPDRAGSTPYTDREQTFLRSVVVTFSNYKPKKEHTTVDKFIGYGLERFYSGENTENIVGGFVFARPNAGVQANYGSSYRSEGINVWPLPVGQIGQANDDSGTGLVATSGQRGLLSGGIHKINGQSGSAASRNFNLQNCDTLTWGITPNATGTYANDQYLRTVSIPMNTWTTCRMFIDPDQPNNFGSTTKRPYSASGVRNPTMSSYKDTGVPMRVLFETQSETTQMVTLSGTIGSLGTTGHVITASGGLVDASITNLPFIDVFFPIGDSKVSRGIEGTNYPMGGANYTFRDKPEWYPQHMTIWVQNFPWAEGDQDGSAAELARTFYFGDDNTYPDGAVMEAEVFIDSLKLFNFTPEINNLSAGSHGGGTVGLKPIDHFSPLQVQISGTSAQDYKNAWVASYPIDITGNVELTNLSQEVRIIEDSILDTTMLDNFGQVTVTSPDGYLTGTPYITSYNSTNTFTISAPATSTQTVASVVFSSTGTVRPPINRANLTNYNTGQFILFGLDNKNYLPLDTSSTYGAGYILCNNYTTENFEEAKDNPLLPRKTDHYSSLSDGGAILGWPTIGPYSLATNDVYTKLGSQLYGGGNYNVGTLASPDATTASPGGNISGAVFQVQDAAAETRNSISTTTGATNEFASNDGWRQKGFMYLSVSGADANNGIGYNNWYKREMILCSAKVTNVASVANNDKFDENNMTFNQIDVSTLKPFNFLNEDETYIIYEMGADELASGYGAGFKSGLKLDNTDTPNILERRLSFTESLKYADNGKTELFIESKLPNLWICPEKYWVTMMFDSPPSTIMRNYSSFCLIGETPDTSDAAGLLALSGSTFNEYTYSYNTAITATGGAAGIYYRLWNLNPTDFDQETIVNDVDYGFGVYDVDNTAGGNAIQGDVEFEKYNYYDISNVVQVGGVKPTESVPFLLYHGGDGSKNRTMEFYSDDYTTELTHRPLFYWRFRDEPPVIDNLAVTPAVDLLADDIDLYNLTTDNLNAVKFTWDESNADDIWYRMLMVDTNTNILDKYHKCVMWLPLNEAQADLAAKPEYTVYNPVSGTSVAAVEDTAVRAVIEGQGGYAAYVSGGAADQITVTSTADWRGFQGLDDWTLVVHWTPALNSRGLNQYIIGQTDDFTSSPDNFIMYKHTNDKIIVKFDSVTLNGTTAITCDGKTPVCLIVTNNNGSKNIPRQSLYVDGVRQDAAGNDPVEITGDNDFVIAPDYLGGAANGAQGMIEEVLLYSEAWDVVNNTGEYIYSSANLTEFSGSSSLGDANYTQSARLFAMDYHNFRGSSKRHLGMSSQVGWRTVTI